MKWKIKSEPNSSRIIRRFAWLPMVIYVVSPNKEDCGDHWVWLEPYNVLQQYSTNYNGSNEWGDIKKWIDD